MGYGTINCLLRASIIKPLGYYFKNESLEEALVAWKLLWLPEMPNLPAGEGEWA